MKPSPVRFAALALLLALSLRAYAQAPAVVPGSFPPGSTYEIGFSPGGTALSVVLHSIQRASQSILAAVYEFTSKPIAQELIAASKRGVKVAVVADYKASLQRYSLVPLLEQNGIPVRRDSRHAISHDKTLVIDMRDVETGSFNFTSAAVAQNAENAVALLNVPDLAAQYAAHWQQLWDESR